jgi:hypothetical protein
LLSATGVLLAPARMFQSRESGLPRDRFRIGFNRRFMQDALRLVSDFLAASGSA